MATVYMVTADEVKRARKGMGPPAIILHGIPLIDIMFRNGQILSQKPINGVL